jgi:hypothetical protein
MADSPLRADRVMKDIEQDVRARLRQHLVNRGGAEDYSDEALFEAVTAVLGRAIDERSHDALLLPELLDADTDWKLRTDLALSTHRPLAGRFILAAKRTILLPLTRWLFEYSQDNFRRQQHVNRILFACIEELAIENARLRRAIDTSAASAGQARSGRVPNSGNPEHL